ncbi:MAG: glutaredoxin [Pseudomonadales bacterium]|nr:glutaredoxin [Pseudomonadales bacterium]
MSRRIFEEKNIHPLVKEEMGGGYADTVNEVEHAIASHRIVVVGMAHNPYVKKARKLLDSLGLDYHYLEYGSYTSEWRRRLVLKMWIGWPTFPMVFVGGKFIGGKQELENLASSDALNALLLDDDKATS